MDGEIPLLIADDDPITGLLLLENAKKWGYAPVLVQDGKEALDFLKKEDSPKIAILDWMMPGMTGLELVKQIRELSFDVPPYLIILTSKNEKEDVVTALGNGADDFIVKPFDPMELRARLGVGRRIVGLNQKLSGAIEEAKRLAHFIAHYDQTTGLPNYHTLLERVSEICMGSTPAVLLFIDIDDFKTINQVLGIDAGDLLLNYFGARLKEVVGDTAMVSRIAADEFAILKPVSKEEMGTPEEIIEELANQITNLLKRPFILKGEEVTVKASMGATWLDPTPGIPPDEFMRRADFSLRRAKNSSEERAVVYDPEMEQELKERFALERELDKAIDSGELTLFLQPQFDTQSKMVGAEALVRWQHPQKGLVPPGVFIPVAEESGLIIKLGKWVLEETCKIIVQTKNSQLPIAVNISAKQFNREQFVDEVKEIVSIKGADPSRLIFEVTESLLIQDVHSVIKKMEELAKIGIRFSIDDFGTGYSSLMYLKRLPISEIKIDRSFIMEIPHDENDVAIVEAICAIAKSMNLALVAEGVETREQIDFLRSKGEITFQGYFFSKPRPWREVVELE